MSFIRSISGIRAAQGDDLTPFTVARYCAAFAQFLPTGSIAIARDGRPSGLWMEYIAAGTFASLGRETHILGVVPTPTAQIYVERESVVAGGIVLTASHNPSEWNGMKFLGGDGVFLDTDENREFWTYLDKPITFPTILRNDTTHLVNNVVERHIEAVTAVLSSAEREQIRNKRYRIAVDAVNAAGSRAIPELLRALGCTPIPLYCDGSGIFPHMPEPVPAHLGALGAAVRENNADFGIAVDPDADRLVLIDEHGIPTNEEMTITLAAASVFSGELPQGFAPICVVNYSTTRAVDAAVLRYGGKVERVPVGEINVVQAMRKNCAVVGGEGSGGVILPYCHYGRDSLVGTALIIRLLARSGGTLSELSASMPQFAMRKTKFPFEGNASDVFARLEAEFSSAELNRDDGVYFNFGTSWLHARASNTEPIIRAIAESPSPDETERLLGIAAKTIAK